MNQLKDKIVLLEKADRIEELEKGRQRSENTEVLAAEEKKMAEFKKRWLNKKNPKKEEMKKVS